jgi:hypothetical protein
LFPLVEVINGDPRHSDHRPVVIKLDGSCTEEVQNCQNRCFKFEARWLQEESREDLVKKGWNEAFLLLGATEVKDGLKGVAGVLTDWNRNVLGDLEKRIKRLKKELAAWIRAPVTDQSVHKEQVVRYRLEKLEEQKDLYWKQRAHMDWLKYVDRNTKFYHAQAMQSRKINRIKRLGREDGSWVQEADLREYIAAQYGELFTSQGVHRINEVLTKVEPRITLR